MNTIIMSHKIICLVILLMIIKENWSQNSVRLTYSRRPNRIDRILCRQMNNGPGIRANAVFNRGGDACRTYCIVKIQSNNTAYFNEYPSRNNIRCAPNGGRCLEGECQFGSAEAPSNPERRKDRIRPQKPVSESNNIGESETRQNAKPEIQGRVGNDGSGMTPDAAASGDADNASIDMASAKTPDYVIFNTDKN